MIGGWYGYKTLVVKEKIKETHDITSFKLGNIDGSALPTFEAGQFLSIKMPKGEFEGVDHDTVRNYSLSSGPGNDFYRISIKREVSNDLVSPDGPMSTHFHDKVAVGTKLLVT